MSSRNVFFCLIFPILVTSCSKNSGQTATITGSGFKHAGQVFSITEILPASTRLIDSFAVDNKGKFITKFNLAETGIFRLSNAKGQNTVLIISPGEKIMLQPGRATGEWNIDGSAETELYASYMTYTHRNLQKVDSLGKVLQAKRLDPDFSKTKISLDSAYRAILENQQSFSRSFIRNHSSSLASLLVASYKLGPNPVLDKTSDAGLLLLLDSGLTARYAAGNVHVTNYHQSMLELINDKEKAIQPYDAAGKGSLAPKISLPGLDGKMLKIPDDKSKLTLLYFWSSWNAVSRKSQSELVSLYAVYHTKGLAIIGISLDKDPGQWKSAISQDKAYWLHVNDVAGLKSNAASLYGVKNLPAFFLIGKNGNIVAARCTFHELNTLINNNI